MKQSVKPLLPALRCPGSGAALALSEDGGELASPAAVYRVSDAGIPLFAEKFLTVDAARQQQHYDAVSKNYLENLAYAHTQEYFAYLDRRFMEALGETRLGAMAEICCGRGEAIRLLEGRYDSAVGVDISENMLNAGISALAADNAGKVAFVQGDATRLPLADAVADSVVMLGGIHHVNDRKALFSEVARILKPGGVFVFREPVSDFFLWRLIRAVVYRLSPALDHETERPLLYDETVPVIEAAGMKMRTWKTLGFFGFCLFMNSDVLVFNRLFRHVPGIRAVTRAFATMDESILKLPGMSRNGLQVVGIAEKPAS